MDQEENKEPIQVKLKTMVCGNCGMELKVKMPSKPDRYKFICPHCQHKVSFVVRAASDTGARKVLPSNILDDRVISRHEPEVHQPAKSPGNVQAGSKPPVLGTPIVPPGKSHYQIMENALVNTHYRFECPGCGKDISIMPRVANKLIKVTCSKCGTYVIYRSVDSLQHPQGITPPPPPKPPVSHNQSLTPPPSAQQDDDDGPATVLLNLGGVPPRAPSGGPPPIPSVAPPAAPPVAPPVFPPAAPPAVPREASWNKPKGMLSWSTGPVMPPMTCRLKPGQTTIGRYDPERPSDVMISGDDEMSRQSVVIIASPNAYDYIYELRIIQSTNAICVNGRRVNKGTTVRLNYGDTIRMGKTNISFIKADD